MPGTCRFYVCRTLLGGDVDCNRRTIYRAETHEPIKTFNYDMKPWTEEMDKELAAELDKLMASP